MDTLSLFSITVVLFIMMDPIGNIPTYLKLLKDVEPARRSKVLIREMLIVLGFMLVFNFIGEYIFSILELSDTAVKLSSGLVLFLTAIKILFPSSNSFRMNLPKGEPFIIPLAMPLIAGPSLLATIMLYAHMETSIPLMLESIFIAWLLALLVLSAAPLFKRYLGNNGLMALERLMGMVLVMLAIQRFMEGIKAFVQTHV
ncbi:MAG TPA: MarC family protein [Parachlamydiaceae bacterium]|nr:MarC family protein [Parachlamydiaceae bacterium]